MVFCGLLLWAMVALVIGEVATRIIRDESLYGSHDLQVIFFAFCMGPAIVYAQLHDRHVRVPLLVRLFSSRVKAIIEMVTLILIAVLSTVAGWISWRYTLVLYQRGTNMGDAFNTPLWLFYLVPSLVWALLFIVVIVTLLIRKRATTPEEEAPTIQLEP